jgi:hypothetical protein
VTAPGGKALRRVLSALRATSRVTPGITRTTGFTCTRSRLGVSTTIKQTFTVTFAATPGSGAAANEFAIGVAVSGQAANEVSAVPFATAQLDPYPASIFVPTPLFTATQPASWNWTFAWFELSLAVQLGGSELHAAVETPPRRGERESAYSLDVRDLAWIRTACVGPRAGSVFLDSADETV